MGITTPGVLFETFSGEYAPGPGVCSFSYKGFLFAVRKTVFGVFPFAIFLKASKSLYFAGPGISLLPGGAEDGLFALGIVYAGVFFSKASLKS